MNINTNGGPGSTETIDANGTKIVNRNINLTYLRITNLDTSNDVTLLLHPSVVTVCPATAGEGIILGNRGSGFETIEFSESTPTCDVWAICATGETADIAIQIGY